ncbi:unnamed protein product [Cyclocybe aegerita]|uniref:Uncharacterized protein n=1 Tax=Cyclocybe aegerita TaxID=1973307 RepID=A0A8S0W7Q9_CYCAE|nr:unnamed protein product [Cyclocybe aegerita]
MTHGFLLAMGGFRHHLSVEELQEICDQLDRQYVPSTGPHREDPNVLHLSTMKVLIAAKKIQFPRLTQADIEDKSKADGLTKAIAILQTTWFLAQCVARITKQLQLAEVEVVTLALASLNAVVYILWWEKPMDVRRPFYIYPDGAVGLPPLREATPGTVTEYSPISTAPRMPQTTNVMRIWKSIVSIPRSGVWRQIVAGIVLVVRPLASDEMSPIVELLTRQGDYRTGYIRRKGEHEGRPYLLIAFEMFGGLHCIPWNYPFQAEFLQLVWRMMSIILIVNPALTAVSLLAFILCPVRPGEILAERCFFRNILLSVATKTLQFSMASYIIARAELFVVVIFLMLYLPDSAFLAVEWMHFLPHI